MPWVLPIEFTTNPEFPKLLRYSLFFLAAALESENFSTSGRALACDCSYATLAAGTHKVVAGGGGEQRIKIKIKRNIYREREQEKTGREMWQTRVDDARFGG